MSKITEPGEPAISANGVDRRGAKIDLREWMQTDPMEQLRKDRENELAAMDARGPQAATDRVGHIQHFG